MLSAIGDIAFVGFNADGADDLAFVTFVDIAAGETIHFTDNEWTGSGFNTGESGFTWTASAPIAAGTIITIDAISDAIGSNLGTVVFFDPTNTGLSASGEIVYAYLGDPATPSVFLSAVTTDSAGLEPAGVTTDGTGLVAGVSAIALPGSTDIGAYTGPRSGEASLAAYRALINDAANWTVQAGGGDQSVDATDPDVPFDATAFAAAPVVLFSEDFNAFTGAGFAPEPAAGQLDSDVYVLTGMSDGDGTFGGTFASGDFGRGVTTGGVSTGGLYALERAADDNAIWFQPGGSDFTPGTFVARITNTASDSDTFTLAFDLLFLNDQPRGNSLNVEVSANGTDYVALPDFDFVTPTEADALGIQSMAMEGSFTLDTAIASGGDLFIRWTSDDVDGGCSRDEFGLDNIVVSSGAAPAPTGPGVLSIADSSVGEGDAGMTTMVFTVTRSGGSNGEVSAEYAVVLNGSADPGDIGMTSMAGTVTFADGETSRTIEIDIIGDTVAEPDETFEVVLSNPVGATLGDATATGTIFNDDVPDLAIHDVQGAGLTSGFAGQQVRTVGIVTAVDGNGFYIQTPDADVDGDDMTSEGILVFTGSAPAVAVGDEVSVTGTVTEYTPGGTSTGNLSTTELASITALTVLSSNNALPSATIIGQGGRMAPTELVTEGIAFYESLEGMLVTVNNPLVVAPTNNFGELYVVADNGVDATNLSARGTLVTQSSVGDGLGVTNTGPGSDYNPERIQIDAGGFTDGAIPDVDTGALLDTITGIISYNFGNFELQPIGPVTVATPSPLLTETTALVGDDDTLIIAQYNVENLDPNDSDGDTDVADGKFQLIAEQIVNNLMAPDIIALQEVQDNSGSANDGTVSADVTLQMLVDAIADAGGPTYSFLDNPFITNNQSGGEPGGNIRVAYLYNADRVDFVEGSLATTPDAATDFAGSRPPLVATFDFAGEEYTLVNNHFSSKGGSSPLAGTTQPSLNGSADERLVQAQNVADYVATLDPDSNVIVLGDLNEFLNEESLDPLVNVGLQAMALTLDASERYTYLFEGNAQALDQTFVSSSIISRATYDIVHANAEFLEGASDHDPAVLAIAAATPTPTPTPAEIDLSLYVLVGQYDLPTPVNSAAPTGSELALEASSVTYNWDTDTLFVIGDEGTSLVQISKTGVLIDSMTLPQGAGAFEDTEGLAYLGDGMFAVVEERTRTVIKFEYTGGTTLDAAATEEVVLGTTIGNIGLEGIAVDPFGAGFILVKELNPLGVFETTLDFANGTASNGSPTTENSVDLFDPALLGVSDLSDVFALSAIPGFAGTESEDNIFVISQEAGRIVQVNRDGTIVNTLNIAAGPGATLSVADQGHEGLTIDRDGTLYVVNEGGGGSGVPQLWVYQLADFPNAAPTAIALVNVILEIAENTNTDVRVKVADVTITDDGIGPNQFAVTGADAAFFEVDSSGLYIKAGTVLDFETKASFSVTITVDDPTAGATPDATVDYMLAVNDVANEGASPLAVTEAAPWSSGSSNSSVGFDWFEITNTGSSAFDLAGVRYDDDSANFGESDAILGISSIAAGESVIVFVATEAELEAARQAFVDTWFGGTAPVGLQFGTTDGAGLGTGSGGDAVTLFDAAGAILASQAFGQSPSASPFATFDNSALVTGGQNNTLSTDGVGGAFSVVNGLGNTETGSPGTYGKLFISEIAPWSSGGSNSPVGVDWFELTNTSTAAIDITGWRFDDDSADFAIGAPLLEIGEIAAGESVVFLNTDDLATASQAFLDTWFGGTAPEGLRFGIYDGAGLSNGGDAVTLFDAAGNLQLAVNFGASTSAPALATFDNAAGIEFGTITTISAPGINGAFQVANALGNTETGSPGTITTVAAPNNDPPSAVVLENTVTQIDENTPTPVRIKVADVSVTDDGVGFNALSVSGADAAFFEVDSTGLYIKAGTILDFETRASYSVSVEVDDPTVGTSPDATVDFTLTVNDVAVETGPALVITEVSPWSSGNNNSPIGEDWFELTNTTNATVDITGWSFDDDSADFSAADPLLGITSIAPGESVIFLNTTDIEGVRQAFIDTWFGGVAPVGLRFGGYDGAGLGGGGDAIYLFDADGTIQTSLIFGPAPGDSPFATFDNSALISGTITNTLSVDGTAGAFSVVNGFGNTEIGSPGTLGDALVTVNGSVSDGYLAGATVFADADGDQVLDDGEARTVTDANGAFTLVAGLAPLVAIGGTDISTGLANTIVLRAPAGATVVNPLTTLIAEVADALLAGGGATTSEEATTQAEAQVKLALGLDAGLDLLNLDLIAAASGSPADPDALAAQKAAATIIEVLKIVQTASGDEGAALEQFAEEVADGSAPALDDTALLTRVIAAAFPQGASIGAIVDKAQEVAEAIDEAATLGEIESAQSAAVNTDPTARDDSLTVSGAETIAIGAQQLLLNDSDADGDTLVVTGVSSATNGTVVLNGGSIVFTPANPSATTGSFTYTVSDGLGGTSSARVTLDLRAPTPPTNQSPIARNDQLSVAQDGSLTIPFASLLVNDSDPDGDPLSVTGIFLASGGGTLSLSEGSAVYTPAAGATGTARLTYTVSDPSGSTDTASVTIAINAVGPVNAAPVFATDGGAFATLGNTPVAFTVVASDADGDTLGYSASAASGGTIVSTGGGSFLYTPDAGFSGSDAFTITVSDGKGGTDTFAATLDVVAPGAATGDWRLVTSDGWRGEIGGSGTVYGTTGAQDVTVLDLEGRVVFDPSFNRGGDVIRLSGDAAGWSIVREGSSVILFDGDTQIVLPVGSGELAIAFADGTRTLSVETGNGSDPASIVIGDQVVTEVLVSITAAALSATVVVELDDNATARLLLAEDGTVIAGGNLDVFGTANGAETIELTFGEANFDPSFNRGGDSILVDAPASAFTGSREGSNAVLEGDDYVLSIPVGPIASEIAFQGDDIRDLVAVGDEVRFADQIFGTLPIAIAAIA